MFIFAIHFAGVVELVDTLDLGSSAARCESSSLSARTKKPLKKLRGFFNFLSIYSFMNFFVNKLLSAFRMQ